MLHRLRSVVFLRLHQGDLENGDRKQDTSALYWIVMDEKRLPEREEILLRFKARAAQGAIYLGIEHHLDVRFL